MDGYEPRQSPEHDCLDRVLSALGHRHRRLILARLFERSPQDVEQLIPTEGLEDVDPEQVAVEIHHSHLPKLADQGFIEREGDRVRRGPKFEEVAPVIELFDAHGSRLPGDWP